MTEAERKDTPEQAEFRAHCQSWLADHHPGTPPVHIPQGALELSDPAAMEWLQTWQTNRPLQRKMAITGSSMATKFGHRLHTSPTG